MGGIATGKIVHPNHAQRLFDHFLDIRFSHAADFEREGEPVFRRGHLDANIAAPYSVSDLSGKAEDKEAAKKVAPYFDGAHFAARITCPVRVSVGFIDETCPPAAVYSGYNALRVKDKAIVHGIGMPHKVFPQFYQQLDQQWLRQK